MTLGRDQRAENCREALVLMLQKLGERAVYMEEFEDDDPALAGIYPTTWKELTDRCMVKARPGIRWCRYELTGYGWLTAMQATGQSAAPEFRERLGRLNAVLKSFVKGRHQEGFEQVHVVAAKANVSEEWLYNVVESRIWEEELNHKGAEFDDSKTMVIIPIDFGMEPIIKQMARHAIIEKLDIELREPITSERRVVYILVEIRKLVERNNDTEKYFAAQLLLRLGNAYQIGPPRSRPNRGEVQQVPRAYRTNSIYTRRHSFPSGPATPAAIGRDSSAARVPSTTRRIPEGQRPP
jgi:hypothetical protein